MTDLLPALITAVGTLVGSFGGFTLAARSQRTQAEQADARAVRDAANARSIALEDEHHEFQLKTLLALQELTRLKTRYTILTIEQDRQALKRPRGNYGQLSPDGPDDFINQVEFSHNVARVTDPVLRERLENFSSLCSDYLLPPSDWKNLSNQESIGLQESRFTNIVNEGAQTAALLGEHLRREIDRHGKST